MDSKQVYTSLNDITKGLEGLLDFCKKSVDNAILSIDEKKAKEVAEILGKCELHKNVEEAQKAIEKLKNLTDAD